MYQPILFIWKFNKGAAGVVHKDEPSAKMLLRHHNNGTQLPGMKPVGQVKLPLVQQFRPTVLFCEGVVAIGDANPPPVTNNFNRESAAPSRVESIEGDIIATDDKNSEKNETEDAFTFETGDGVAKKDDFGFDS